MARSRPLSGIVALLLALGLLAGFPLAAAAADEVAFTINDDRITESSGLARDLAAGGYWTVNDSGDRGVAYGISPTGKVLGTLNYRAQPEDVEAVAVFEDRLYIADIGDNNEEREFVTVYYFDDPRASGLTVSYRAWDFTYPDGPHDAEALLVNEKGRLYIVTKGAEGGVYIAPSEPSREGVNELRRVGQAPAMVTDGTFLPGGEQIALLTPGSVEVVDADTYREVASADLPNLSQPESLTVSLDDETLLVGSEGKKSKVYAMAVPGAATPTPTPTPTPSASRTAAPDPGDVPEDDPTAANTGRSRAGTLLALGLAAVVAIVAGGVVVLVRKS